MRNIRLTIEYDGSRFQGWQRLGAGESTANTISGKLCEVLSRMTGQFPGAFLCIQDRDGSTCLRSDGEFPYGLHTSYDGNPSLPEPISSI